MDIYIQLLFHVEFEIEKKRFKSIITMNHLNLNANKSVHFKWTMKNYVHCLHCTLFQQFAMLNVNYKC